MITLIYIFNLYVDTCVKCEAIYRAICDLKWYKLESKEGRTPILLMMRANEPLRITAGKLFPLTMTMFCSARLFLIYLISFVCFSLLLHYAKYNTNSQFFLNL